MFDIFGLRQEPEAPRAEFPSESAHAEASENKRLWAVLLILDTLFLFVFGGALAGMAYVRWFHATPPAYTIRRIAPQKIPAHAVAPVPAPAAPAATPPATAAPAQKAPAPQPRRAAAKAERPEPVAAKGPVGSPGVLSPELPHRQASLSAPGSASEPTAPTPQTRREAAAKPAPHGKAKPVEFTCVAKDANEVKLRGPFLVRTGGYKKMTRGDDGLWHTEVSLLPGTYRYQFVIDGRKSKQQTVDVQ